jgi:uncharacterized protein (DUF1015 family)
MPVVPAPSFAAPMPPIRAARVEEAVPKVRAFRALRFSPESIDDLAAVVSPPYDVISPAEQRTLLDRHPRNVVRLDLPEVEPGEEPDDRYRRAARTLAAWRSDGTLHKDPRPSLYAYEQVYQLPHDGAERRQIGFFGRLLLEPLEPGSAIRPHERTMAAAREDRYRLLRATGVNTSPVVTLFDDPTGDGPAALNATAATPPDAEIVVDGVCHRLWVIPDDGEPDGRVARLTRAVEPGPLTIADGHHRYETALRYRDERRMSRSCEEDPAFDYILSLFLDSRSQSLTVLPTHRLVHGLGEDAAVLPAAAAGLFDVVPADRSRLERFGTDPDAGGSGRFGLWAAGSGHLLTARRAVLEPLLPAGGDAVRRLDVTIVGAALERLAGIDAEALAQGERLTYTKSAREALDRVDDPSDPADAAFLLEPTPVRSIIEVAAAGDVMPQKSTYFHPKPLTGLVINPHEW